MSQEPGAGAREAPLRLDVGCDGSVQVRAAALPFRAPVVPGRRGMAAPLAKRLRVQAGEHLPIGFLPGLPDAVLLTGPDS